MDTYLNIISNKIVSFDRYIVIGKYHDHNEAVLNLENDVKQFKQTYKHTQWYKMFYPFAYATIKEA